MKDYVIRGTAAQGNIRVFAARTTNMVSEAQKTHGLSPVASAAIGRTMTAAVMMGIDMKGERDSLSIIIKGGGPLGNVVVVANSTGRVKGYVDNPTVDLPLNPYGKLDVAQALGKKGKITVIKDLGLKEPYVGQSDIISGEIAEDIAYYMTVSEQNPSAVGLGVLINPDASVKAAGGFIIQPMPDATEEVIQAIEDGIKNAPPVSKMIDEGKTPEEIVGKILNPYGLKVHQIIEPYFSCDCNRERLKSVILTLGEDELRDIIQSDEKAEMVCHYCNKKYIFEKDELEEMLRVVIEQKGKKEL